MKASAKDLSRIASWMLSGDTGQSSESLCAIYLGLAQKWWNIVRWPHDPDDFGRCVRFLRDCVDADKREALVKIAGGYRKEWRAIADNWKHLNDLYADGANEELYKEMKRLGL